MTNSNQHLSLIKYQRLVWLICVAYLALVCVLQVMNSKISFELSKWGTIFVLAATVSQLFVISHDFKRSGNRKFMALGYVLISVIIVSTFLVVWLL